MDMLVAFFAPALVGIAVGVLSGLLGIGGGTILVPVFRLAFGMSPQSATATSLFTIVPTSVSGVVSHVRHRTCVPWLGLAAGFGGALTSPFGVWLASVSPGWLIMLVAALIIGYSSVNMLRKAFRVKKEPAAAGARVAAEAAGENSSAAHGSCGSASSDKARVSCGGEGESRVQAPSETHGQPSALPMTPKRLAFGFCIGLVAGLASGYAGVGGGFIMVPLMLSLLGVAMKQASGTSLIAVAILAVPGVVAQIFLGNVQYLAGIAVAAGSIPGAILGARLVQIVPERQLRFLFGGFLVVAAVVLVLNEFGVLG